MVIFAQIRSIVRRNSHQRLDAEKNVQLVDGSSRQNVHKLHEKEAAGEKNPRLPN